MRYLLIDTMPEEDAACKAIAAALRDQGNSTSVISTRNMDIKPCIGCNACWLKTPGVCAIKDDYQKILIALLACERVIFFAQAKLGFVSHEMKDVVDRILPLDTMYLQIKDGQFRHISRYGKDLEAALVYSGEADQAFLNQWMGRVMLNLEGESIGAFKTGEKEALIHALTDR